MTYHDEVMDRRRLQELKITLFAPIKWPFTDSQTSWQTVSMVRMTQALDLALMGKEATVAFSESFSIICAATECISC